MRRALLAAMLIASGAAHAQVYKCVDAAGKTIYSQAPCAQGARSSTIGSRAAAAPASGGAAAAQKSAAQLDQEFRKRRQEQAEADKKSSEQAAQAKDKEENCRNARTQLVSLNSGVRQMRVNDKGERYYLDDSQVEQEKARAQRAVDNSCK